MQALGKDQWRLPRRESGKARLARREGITYAASVMKKGMHIADWSRTQFHDVDVSICFGQKKFFRESIFTSGHQCFTEIDYFKDAVSYIKNHCYDKNNCFAAILCTMISPGSSRSSALNHPSAGRPWVAGVASVHRGGRRRDMVRISSGACGLQAARSVSFPARPGRANGLEA